MRILDQTCSMVQHSSNMVLDAMGSEDKYDHAPSIVIPEGNSSRDESNNTSCSTGRSGSSSGNDFIATSGSTIRCEPSEPLLPTTQHHLSLPMSRGLSLPLYNNSPYDTSYMQRLPSASSCDTSMSRSTSASTYPSSQESGSTRRRKRGFTEAEKIRIAMVREVGACSKCSKSHRKCGHALSMIRDMPEDQRQGTERAGLYEFPPFLVTENQPSSSALSSEARQELSELPFGHTVRTSSQGELVRVKETPELISDDGELAELYHGQSSAGVPCSSYESDRNKSKRKSNARNKEDNNDTTSLYSTPNPLHMYPSAMAIPFEQNTAPDTVQNEQSQVQSQHTLSSAYEPHGIGIEYSPGRSENPNRHAPMYHEHCVTDFGSAAQSLASSTAENSKRLTVQWEGAITRTLDEICQSNQMEQDMRRTHNSGSHAQVPPVWMTASNITANTDVTEASHSNEQSIGMFTGYSVIYRDHVSPGCAEGYASPRFQGHHWPNYEEAPDGSFNMKPQ